MNKIDKIVSYFSASAGRKRAEDRFKTAMIGDYKGSSTSSAIFQEFMTTTTDADSSANTYSRKRLVERSRDNVRNVPVATALVNRICDHSIGDRGLNLHPQIDHNTLGMSEEQKTTWQENTTNEFRIFAENKDLDYYRDGTFAELTYLTLKSELEGGDCLTLFANERRKRSVYDLRLQSVEGEYLSNPNNKQNTSELKDGVVKNTNGQPTSYWISNKHPGDTTSYGAKKWQQRPIFGAKTGRRNILLHYDQIRFGQTRGIPVLGPVTGKLLQLERLSEAELLAAVLNSYYTIVVKGGASDTEFKLKNPGESETLTDDDKLTLGSGSIARVKPGTIIESFDPKRPNSEYSPFFMHMVSEIGAAVGVPRSLVLMVFDRSYSASRGEVLLAWVYFMAKRTHIAVNFCQPVYEAFLDEAIAKGRISAPGYFKNESIRQAYVGSALNQWTGPTRPAIDELREAKAFELYNNMGTMSKTEITAKTTGRDFIKVNDDITREHNMRVEAGLEDQQTEISEELLKEETE